MRNSWEWLNSDRILHKVSYREEDGIDFSGGSV